MPSAPLSSDKYDLRIAIVGPCSSGKSTLRRVLQEAGYQDVRNPSQEHTEIVDRWQRYTQPDILIFLDVDYETTLIRRPGIDLGPQRVEKQKQRLSHARAHADFYIDTSLHTPDEIAEATLLFLADI